MSKKYRDKKRHIGVQAVHKGRHVHALVDAVSLEELALEVL